MKSTSCILENIIKRYTLFNCIKFKLRVFITYKDAAHENTNVPKLTSELKHINTTIFSIYIYIYEVKK